MRLYRRPSDHRYFAILEPQVDLLGDLVVVTFNGSSQNHLGACRTTVCRDMEAANELVFEIEKVRLRHGYLESPFVEVPK